MFRFMDRFSFYLRRQWNMSHFTIGIPCAMVSFSAPIVNPDTYVFTKVWFIATVALLSLACAYRAKKHNLPGNVDTLCPRWCGMVLLSMDAMWLIIGALAGVWLLAVRQAADIALVLVVTTPGYKVPYEPDNLNYAPGAA